MDLAFATSAIAEDASSSATQEVERFRKKRQVTSSLFAKVSLEDCDAIAGVLDTLKHAESSSEGEMGRTHAKNAILAKPSLRWGGCWRGGCLEFAAALSDPVIDSLSRPPLAWLHSTSQPAKDAPDCDTCTHALVRRKILP